MVRRPVMAPDVGEALVEILEIKCPPRSPINYAKTYAKAMAPLMFVSGSEGRKLELTQILYILSNLKSWRGERAREIIALLKEYQGQLKKQVEE